jgi:hypothetical protein
MPLYATDYGIATCSESGMKTEYGIPVIYNAGITSYKTRIGGPAGWMWSRACVDYDKAPRGSGSSWEWKDVTYDTIKQVPSGNATCFTWIVETTGIT